MKYTLSLLSLFALAGSASAAVVTNGFVQNKGGNVATGGVANQTTTSGGAASRGIDGNTNGNWGGGSVTHTSPTDTTGYWEVDLGGSRDITDITLWNRTDCCQSRLSNYSVLVSNDPAFGSSLWSSGNQAGAPAGTSINFAGVNQMARYVRVQRDGPSLDAASPGVISLAEVQVNANAIFNYANLAIGSTASQSSTLSNANNPTAAKAVDGGLATSFNAGSTTHTDPAAAGAVFWETVLAAKTNINEISLYNRGDCCPSRLSNFRLSVFDGSTEVWGQDYFKTVDGGYVGDNGLLIFSIQEDTGGFFATGDRVRVELIGGLNNEDVGANTTLSLREVEIYGVAIPEPSAFALFGLGGLGLLLRRRRK